MSNMVPPATLAMTLEIRDRCLCLHAQRAARALARRFDRVFRPLGMTSGQFSLLNALNRPEPAPMGAVAAVLAMDRTTLTAALKPLERRGLVRSEPGVEDRRSRRVTLTDEGRVLLARAVPLWCAEHAAVDAEVAAAGGDLRGGLAALAADPGSGQSGKPDSSHFPAAFQPEKSQAGQ